MSPPNALSIWYWITTAVLMVLLFFPVNKLIWVMRVRRLERKLGRQSTEEERNAEKRTARMIAGVIVITFALLFNRTLLIPG